jgi:acetolactate synthase-1/2/3 large subunit
VISSDASVELAAFAEHVNVPVYSTFMGKGALSARHPLHLGIAGCWGEYPGTEAARNADVILALGCRFSDIHCSSWVPGYTYNIPPTKLIHVDIDPQEIGRNYPTELGIVGDARSVLLQLRELAEKRGPKRDRSPWNDQVEAYKEEWSNFIEPEKASSAVPIDPRRVIGDLRRIAPEDTLMITDTGNHQTWVEQYWDVYEPRSVFTPGGFAGMGFGTYGVLGLKLARPDRPAVCVTSDGSFMMFPGAVATATEYDIPAVWVILNNYTIGVIRDLQRFYMDGREIGTSFIKHSTGEFWNPDFVKMAEAMGAGGVTVEQPGELAEAFDTALSSGKPYVVDVRVNRDTAVPLIGTWKFPPIQQAEPTFGKRLVLT